MQAYFSTKQVCYMMNKGFAHCKAEQLTLYMQKNSVAGIGSISVVVCLS